MEISVDREPDAAVKDSSILFLFDERLRTQADRFFNQVF
jgi:hypothetical protein